MDTLIVTTGSCNPTNNNFLAELDEVISPTLRALIRPLERKLRRSVKTQLQWDKRTAERKWTCAASSCRATAAVCSLWNLRPHPAEQPGLDRVVACESLPTVYFPSTNLPPQTYTPPPDLSLPSPPSLPPLMFSHPQGFWGIQTNDLRWQQSVKASVRTADPTNHQQHGASTEGLEAEKFLLHGARTTALASDS